MASTGCSSLQPDADAPADTTQLDARGLKCPLPVLKAEKRLRTLASGESFLLLADDPVARIDVPVLCKRGGHGCTIARHGDALAFTITKGG